MSRLYPLPPSKIRKFLFLFFFFFFLFSFFLPENNKRMALKFTAPADQPVLTEDQVASFKRDGFLIVENFLTEEEAAALTGMSDDLEHMPDVRGSVWKYWNMQKPVEGETVGKRFLDRLENFVDFHEGWANLFLVKESKLVRATTELFGGEEAILWKEKLNFKKPGSSGFAPHQDAQVFLLKIFFFFSLKLFLTLFFLFL